MVVFLNILKIIGIILLSIISFVILIILLVLFWPLSYRINAEKYENKDFKAYGNVSWLLKFINVKFSYEKEFSYRVNVLGIKIKSSSDEDKDTEDNSENKKENKSDKTQKKDSLKKNSVDETVNESELNDNSQEYDSSEDDLCEYEYGGETVSYRLEGDFDGINNESAQVESTENNKDISSADKNISSDETALPSSEDNNAYESNTEYKEPKKSFSDLLSEKLNGFYNKISKIIDKICLSLKNVNEKRKLLVEEFNNEKNRKAVALILKEVKYLLKKIKPRNLKANINFGSLNPETTGTFCAVMGFLYPLFGNSIKYEPDFTKDIFEGDVKLKGHFMLFSVLKSFAVVYFNKDVKALYNKISK